MTLIIGASAQYTSYYESSVEGDWLSPGGVSSVSYYSWSQPVTYHSWWYPTHYTYDWNYYPVAYSYPYHYDYYYNSFDPWWNANFYTPVGHSYYFWAF